MDKPPAFTLHARIYIPEGQSWRPAVTAEILEKIFRREMNTAGYRTAAISVCLEDEA